MQFTNAFPNRKPVDYYELFGLTPDATFRDIEAAYWRLAKDPHARDDIALLNEAYEVLSHKDRRAEYDTEHGTRRPHPAARGEVAAPNRPALTGKLWEFVG
jgi:curved DNA-binding protein CbpA